MSSNLATRIAEEHAAAHEALASAAVSADRRKNAVEALTSAGLPTTRDENWKYANLRVIERVKFAPSAPRARNDISAADLPAPIEGYARYTFIDGVFVEALSHASQVKGIAVKSLRAGGAAAGAKMAAVGASAASVTSTPAVNGSAVSAPNGEAPANPADNRFALLNDAFATDGAAIDVGSGVDCPACIELIFVATEPAQTAASYPRVELNVQANARVGIIERHISLRDDTNFVNGAVHVAIGQGAQVNHYRLQQAGARATWFDTLSADVAKDARYEIHAVGLGALSARSTLHIQLSGERAEAYLHVVSLADGQQVHDAYALVEHIAPNTKSEQNVRAIAAARSRSAFNSKVVVRKHAQGTDSRQSLRGLLAGAQAEIDVRPQLEIYTDDVKCNHGATAGKLDDDMLFYLLSRGIERDVAQQLLKWAFLEDVVSKIAVPELRRHIEASLAGQMKDTAALKELI